MTSDRPYRKALSVDMAVQILLEGRGKQWDSSVVNAFLEIIANLVDEKTKSNPLEQQPTLSLSQ